MLQYVDQISPFPSFIHGCECTEWDVLRSNYLHLRSLSLERVERIRLCKFMCNMLRYNMWIRPHPFLLSFMFVNVQGRMFKGATSFLQDISCWAIDTSADITGICASSCTYTPASNACSTPSDVPSVTPSDIPSNAPSRFPSDVPSAISNASGSKKKTKKVKKDKKAKKAKGPNGKRKKSHKKGKKADKKKSD